MSHPRRLVVLVLLAVVLGAAAAVACGLLSLVTTFGTSMSPRIAADDLVVVRAASYAVGDVVAYRSPELDQVVLHRIVERDGDRFVFQGDHNAFLDPERLPASAVLGKELLHVPGGGTWLRRLTSPPALAACTFLLLAGGTAATNRRHRRKERRTVSSPHRPTVLTTAATGAAVLGLAGALLGGVAWTRPATATGPTAGVGSTLDFSYSAAVPASAAYDSRTVTAPQPVFRALTEVVDVRYAYTGPSGTIALHVELSDGSGWRSTLPLRAAAPLRSEQAGVVRLDLAAFERRARAAAAVTGIPSGSTTVTVVARVRTTAGDFAPELPLTLDAQALRLTDAAALTATSTSAGPSVATPARLSVLGRRVDVHAARTASAAMLLLALLLGAALAAASRRRGPVSEAESVRRRHKDLLLPVLPIALAPGRPVVDVPTVGALMTLAQRYGLLVLHWERGGVTTYVVQDEGTTYRYRESVPCWTPSPAPGRVPAVR